MSHSRRPYGTGSVTRRKDGYWAGRVEVGYIDGQRKRKTVTARTKAEAVKKLDELNRRKLLGTVTVGQAPTLEAWLDTWLQTVAAPRVAPGTLRSHRTSVEQHTIPYLGAVRLDKLRPPAILRWHDTLRRQGLTSGTVLRAHGVLAKALEDAKRQGYLPGDNPARLVDRPRATSKEPAFLDRDQARLLLQTLYERDDPYGSRWAMALLAGQRQGEVLGLRWQHVDLDQRQADIQWQLRRLTGAPLYRDAIHLTGPYYLMRPKAGVRKMVPLAKPLAAWLTFHRQQEPPGPLDLVWTHDGGPVSAHLDYKRWVRLLAELDLPRVPLHSARHTCVSLLLDDRVPENTILQVIGHSSVASSRQYQHLGQEAKLAAVDQLGAEMLALPADPGAVG